MGTLHYGSAEFELDDDALHHFTAVMVAKLRRGEPFLAVVREDDDGIERIWLHTAANVRIATRTPNEGLDRHRLEHMMTQANKGGLHLGEPWRAPVAA